MFFYTGPKIGLFGIYNEGLSTQDNFLIPENILKQSKNSDGVLSLLTHKINSLPFNNIPEKLSLFCDNAGS